VSIAKDVHGFPHFGTSQSSAHNKEHDIRQILVFFDISAAILRLSQNTKKVIAGRKT
jgi:hypothetical protein